MWDNDAYVYTPNSLKRIAANYEDIYSGIPLSDYSLESNPFSIAEYKADFDLALDWLGTRYRTNEGKFREAWHTHRWSGLTGLFSTYRFYSLLQRAVIADIMGIGENELYSFGLYDVNRLKRHAYWLMAQHLNGGIDGTNYQSLH